MAVPDHIVFGAEPLIAHSGARRKPTPSGVGGEADNLATVHQHTPG